ncbi:RNA polymerase sigma factor [Alteromonas lipolytica]|uniref:RNA polymerase sigma factor n=1 Tax=Alteromonas lipolytica TaxID=1856405 RepID=UPI0009F4A230|nr:sigma-70 family RNA polymerase sigma factor [Alteromonas lipolytica]
MAKLGFLRGFLRRESTTNCNESLFRQYRQTGDTAALSALYDQHSNNLYYYLLVMSDPITAADVTQKVWLKIIESCHDYQDKGRFQAWLFTIGHRMLIDEFRANKRWQADTDPDTLGAPLLTNIDTSDFHQLLKQLPFAQREAFSLQQEGFSLQDIATICSVPVETVKTRLRYARNTLRKHWKES